MARIGAHAVVDEATTGFELKRNLLPALGVGAKHGGAQAIGRLIGQANGLGLVGGRYHGRHRPERFLVKDWHAGAHPVQEGGRVKSAAAGWALTSEETTSAELQTVFDLVVEGIAQVESGQGSDGGCLVERIAQHLLFKGLPQVIHKDLADGLDHDKPLGRNATLAAVHQSGGGADHRRLPWIGVVQHQVGIATPQLEHRLQQVRPCGGGQRAPRLGAAGERDAAHRGMGKGRLEVLGINDEILKHADREPCLAENPGDGQGAAADIRGVL